MRKKVMSVMVARRMAVCLSLLATFCFAFPAVVSASKVVPISLPEIVEFAGKIVHGRVLENKTGRDEETNLLCTWTTVKVDEDLKGNVDSETITFKQLGGTDEDSGISDQSFRAKFSEGQEVLLFLYPESKLGFSAPIGIQQGVFNVVLNPNTQTKHVTNGMPAHIIFSDTPNPPQARMKSKMEPYDLRTKAAMETCKSMQLDDFKTGVKSLVVLQKEKDRAKAE